MAVKKPISLTDFSVSFVSVFRGRRSARFLLFPRTIDAGTAMKLELYLFFLSFLAPGLTSFFFLPRTSSFFDVSIVAVCAPVDGFQRRLRNLHSSRAVFLSLVALNRFISPIGFSHLHGYLVQLNSMFWTIWSTALRSATHC